MHQEVSRQRQAEISCIDVQDGCGYAADAYIIGCAQSDEQYSAVSFSGDKKSCGLCRKNLDDVGGEVTQAAVGKQVQLYIVQQVQYSKGGETDTECFAPGTAVR